MAALMTMWRYWTFSVVLVVVLVFVAVRSSVSGGDVATMVV